VSDDALTARQLEVLKLIASGQCTKEVARVTETSANAVEAHRAQMMEKLGVRNVVNLVTEAGRRGPISVK
jgi:DNA-binding NarL/FixJ family response regulator